MLITANKFSYHTIQAAALLTAPLSSSYTFRKSSAHNLAVYARSGTRLDYSLFNLFNGEIISDGKSRSTKKNN